MQKNRFIEKFESISDKELEHIAYNCIGCKICRNINFKEKR